MPDKYHIVHIYADRSNNNSYDINLSDFAHKIDIACNETASQGYELANVIPIIKGAAHYADANPKYIGFSVTHGIILIFKYCR